ncbi:hypothetical protein NDU88_010141 [Pleurodeles waltl]|uniref:Uncharacterized protein n=1 Tax=Pleurodeles waltl TaxID=8319 RepID=A0AAV7QXT5_PLEWA|nr:hypothetical protein NDU88_010141 [Pleurodeles waltl]
MPVWVHPEEAVEIPGSVHQEVFEAAGLPVRQRVTPDLLAHPDQEGALGFVHQHLFCLLAIYDACQESN